jgi:hypothetical protein
MSTDFRAELQRLVEAYDEHGGKWPDHHEQALFQAVEDARAALSQPEPVAPTDEELLEVASNPLGYVHIRVDSKELEANGEELIAFARAVLTRWGTPANTINQETNHA